MTWQKPELRCRAIDVKKAEAEEKPQDINA
jgi:hypothetical protein